MSLRESLCTPSIWRLFTGWDRIPFPFPVSVRRMISILLLFPMQSAISTRESQRCRERVLHLGISQISGGSRTSVGGYTEEERPEDTVQFDISDRRSLDEVVCWLMEMGYVPSFCTACYREGRTGDRFMSLCKSGQIQNCCLPNALMTLKEYLQDYASAKTRTLGDTMIQSQLQDIPNEKVRKIVEERLVKIAGGERDFRF